MSLGTMHFGDRFRKGDTGESGQIQAQGQLYHCMYTYLYMYIAQDYLPNTCHFAQVLDADLDLRTVKHTIWKSGGDMRLYYREIEPRTTTSMSTSSNDVEIDTPV